MGAGEVNEKLQRARAKLKSFKEETMSDWIWGLIFFVGYFALLRWILPRFGVPT
jgi:hypothetical protein